MSNTRLKLLIVQHVIDVLRKGLGELFAELRRRFQKPCETLAFHVVAAEKAHRNGWRVRAWWHDWRAQRWMRRCRRIHHGSCHAEVMALDAAQKTITSMLEQPRRYGIPLPVDPEKTPKDGHK